MRIFCGKHQNVALNNGYCIECEEEERKTFKSLSTNVTWCGDYGRPSSVIINGKHTKINHNGGYIEWSIPGEIEEEINKFIGDKIDEYEKTCMCMNCQLKREIE